MESDESIDFVYSEAVNAYGSVVAKKNTKILASISKKVKMLIYHVFIHSSVSFNWSLPSLLNRTEGQLKFPARGEELAFERVVGVVVHAKQQISNANCQCYWRSCNEVTKLRINKRPAIWYFSIFLFEIQKNTFTKMFYLYLQSSSASRQPTISNLMFFANPVYRVRSHPNAWQLTVSPGGSWERRFQKVFCDLWISCYRKLGRGARCIKVGNGPLSKPLEKRRCCNLSSCKVMKSIDKSLWCHIAASNLP